jgi:TolA-binding protein
MKKIYIFLLCVLLSSCAYYNTFYNAKKYYEAAQKRPLNAQGRPNAQAIEDYNRVIRKCGFVIAEYPKSKWVPEAVFLLGKALYFRGNNQIQALEKFEELIQFYPNSKHIPDAIIFLARVKYDLNQHDESFEILREFINNPTYSDHHAAGLMAIADLYVRSGEYIQSQHYLSLLIDRFPRSAQYIEAHILLGKSYFDIHNYDKSLETFNTIFRMRKIPRNLQNDALYFIAYNHYHLGHFELAYQKIRNLERRETRTAQINEFNILLARIYIEIDRVDDAIELFNSIISNNQRTLFSAEAAFHLGELYFRQLQDFDLAIENFNRVRRESQNSPFVDRATSRATIVTQIKQYYNPNTNLTVSQLMAEHFKLAEFYLNELSLPDSALVIYERIPLRKQYIADRIDSLYATILNLENPSLQIEAILVVEIIEDIEVSEPIETPQSIDDISEMLDAETLAMLMADIDIDDFDFDDSIESDTTAMMTEVEPVDVVSQTDIQIEQLRNQIELLSSDIQIYDDVYIPHSLFIQMVIHSANIEDDIRANEIYFTLLETYPENRFTEAAIEFMSGEKVTFLTRDEKHQISRFEYAMGYYDAGEETFRAELPRIITILDSLTTSAIPDLVDRSRFTLGFLLYFDLADSLRAKPFLDSLQTISPTSDYAVFSRRFYDNGHFIKIDRLPAIVEAELRMAEELEQARIHEMEQLEMQRIAAELEKEELEYEIKDDLEFSDYEESEAIEKIETYEEKEEPDPVESEG